MSSEDASNSRSCETKYSPKKRGAKKTENFPENPRKSQEQMKRRKQDENCSDIR